MKIQAFSKIMGIGALIDSFDGFWFGLAIRILFAYIVELKKHIRLLQEQSDLNRSKLIEGDLMVDQTVTDGIQVDGEEMEVEEISITEDIVDVEINTEDVTQVNHAIKEPDVGIDVESASNSSEWNEPEEHAPDQSYQVDKLTTYIKTFFTTGNVGC